MRFLAKRLDDLNVVDRIPEDKEKVFFGAWVSLEDEDGETLCYRIVGPDEFDVRENKISMDSPLAKSLMGKRIDDEITFRSPEGEKYYCIVDVAYR